MSLIKKILGCTAQGAVNVLGPASISPEEDLIEGDRVYLEYPAKGISLILNEDGLVFCIQLYGADSDYNYSCYVGELFKGVSMSSSRTDIRAALGPPLRSADGVPGKGLFGKYLFAWDKYMIDFCEYHFEYSEELHRTRLLSVEASNLGSAN